VREMLYDRTHGWHSTPLETVALIAMLIGIILVVRTFSGTPVGIIFAGVAFLGYIFDAHLYIPAAICLAIFCTWVSWWRSDRNPDRYQQSWPKLLLDMTIAGGGFLLYELGRIATNDGQSRALENAERMIAIQNWLHLPNEAAFQDLIISHDLLLRSVNKVYSFFFLSTVIGCLVWLYLNRPEVYRRVRNALGLSTLIAIGVFALFPMAPPRLTAASSMIDSHARVGSRHGFVNQFAALPSLHIGWLSLVGWGMWTSLRRFRGLLFAIVPASVMMVAVVATGNHFWLDGVFGSALCLGAVAATGPRLRPAPAPSPYLPGRLSIPAMLATRARVRNAMTLLIGLLIFTFLGRLLDPVFTPYWGYLAGQVALLGLVILFVEGHCRARPLLSPSTYTIISLAMTVDVLGTAGHMYARVGFYDKIVHFMGTAAVTAVIHDICVYRGWGRTRLHPHMLAAIAAAIGISVGVVWEVYEVFGDVVFATARNGGYWDTAHDLLFDSFGAITAAFILSWRIAEPAEQGTLEPGDPQAAGRLAGSGH
jgi:uncharacterized membrane protein YjdF